MKIIIDCNVIISAGLGSKVCINVLKKVVKNHRLFCSQEIFAEYIEVAKRKKFSQDFEKLKLILINIAEIAEFVKSTKKLEISLSDQSDQIYLQAAVECNANFFITGNIKHFPSGKYKNTQILSPADFLKKNK